MADQATEAESELVATLNDLLQLDHDAVEAYGIAIDNLDFPDYKDALRRFRGDHERHIEALTRLVEDHGGTPVELAHVPSGFFKLAVQKVGAQGGDREILLAFKANERQVRDKYQRLAGGEYPPGVAEVLRENAADEKKHYNWATETLDQLGAGADTPVGKAEGAFEKVHETAADMVEGPEREAMAGAEKKGRQAKRKARRASMAAADKLDQAAGAAARAGAKAQQRGGAAAKASPAAQGAASALSTTAGYMRTQNFGAMRGDIEQEVDRHPIRSAAIALGAGYLLGKIFS